MKYTKNYFFMRCAGEDVVSITDDLFNQNNVLWKSSTNATTDGVDALSAIPGGFSAKATEITPNTTFTPRLAVGPHGGGQRCTK